jgi:hypothetical protein
VLTRSKHKDAAAKSKRMERETVIEETPGRYWSPAQFVAFITGLVALIFGAIALAKTGIDGSLKTPHEELWGFHHTPLLALIEIGFGALLVLAAFGAVRGRILMALLGAAAVGFGVLILADAWPGRMHRWFGVHDRNAWLFVIVGGVVLLTAFLAPTVMRPARRVVQLDRDDRYGDRDDGTRERDLDDDRDDRRDDRFVDRDLDHDRADDGHARSREYTDRDRDHDGVDDHVDADDDRLNRRETTDSNAMRNDDDDEREEEHLDRR